MQDTTEATYCPEDNKLRLYTGRVPRDKYETLRDAGYKSTPKQDCDFVATWTPAREDIALALLDEGDDIGDEDQSPEDRAADRAERFSMYRDKRRGEAHGHADNYDAQPIAHGYQDPAKADREARKHNRQRTNAGTQWSKAEYWQRRTTGVISHALYNSEPHVRRGRILRLESELRRHWSERCKEHLSMRLTYERAMLAEQGGTAADVDMIPGGFLSGHQIIKVNRSPLDKSVVSVQLRDKEGNRHQFNIQRMGESVYRAPTEEEAADFKVLQAELKAKAKALNALKPKLINPTKEDAQRLQDIWNNKARELWVKYCEPSYINHDPSEFEPSELLPLTQKQYSAHRKNNCATEVIAIQEDGLKFSRNYYDRSKEQTIVFKVRKAWRGGNFTANANRVIVITDKPQKSLPTFTAEYAEGLFEGAKA